MKTILLVRHAKSSWSEEGLADYDRPLNERGKRDAPEMAQRLKKRKIILDVLLTSSAKRARQTANLFAENLGLKKEKIILSDSLYMSGPSTIYEAISKAPAEADIIALFAHNPGITDFINTLTEVKVDDMPTCSVYAAQCDTDNWQSFEKAPKTFLFFDYPKLKP